MNLFLAASIIASAALVFVLCRLVRKNSRRPTLPVTAEWIDQLSIERYRPMMRLLDARELEFVRSQPGFSSGMVRALRAQRALLFRQYLESLSEDFQRVCAALKLVMLQSRYDRPDLAAALVRQQAMFTAAMFQARVRLVFYRAGIGGVDVTELVQIFDGLRLELRSLVPSAAELGA